MITRVDLNGEQKNQVSPTRLQITRVSSEAQILQRAENVNTSSNSLALCNAIISYQKRVMSDAFNKLTSQQDREKPKRAAIVILGLLFDRKLRQNKHLGVSALQRYLFASAQKLDLPDWFKRELVNVQSTQKILDELPKHMARIVNNSQKWLLLTGIQSLCRKDKQDKDSIEARLTQLNNMCDGVTNGTVQGREINTWYRNNLARMSPEMRRVKNMLTRYQELIGQYDKEKKKLTECESRYRNSQLTNHEYSRKIAELARKVQEQLAPVKKEVSAIINLINGRKYDVLKIENGLGKYENLTDLVSTIIEQMELFPQPTELLAIEQIANSISNITKQIDALQEDRIDRIKIVIGRQKNKLLESQSKLARNVGIIVSNIESLTSKTRMSTPRLTSTHSSPQKKSQSNGSVEEELLAARQQIQMLTDQLDKQRIQYQEDMVRQIARHNDQITDLQTQLQMVKTPVQNENQKLRTLQNVTMGTIQTKQEEEGPRNKMLLPVWPQAQKGAQPQPQPTETSKPEDPSKPLARTDSTIFYEIVKPKQQPVTLVNTPQPLPVQTEVQRSKTPQSSQENGDTLRLELQECRSEIERLNEIIRKYDESFKSYQQGTAEYKDMIANLKVKLMEADRLADQRISEELDRQVGDIGIQMSRMSHEDLETGRRLIELEENLAMLRDEHCELKITEAQLNEKIKELRDQNVRLHHDKRALQVKCEHLEREFARIVDENREFSIVLSKRQSFGSGLYSFNDKKDKDSIFTFTPNFPISTPIAPRGQMFEHKKTYDDNNPLQNQTIYGDGFVELTLEMQSRKNSEREQNHLQRASYYSPPYEHEKYNQTIQSRGSNPNHHLNVVEQPSKTGSAINANSSIVIPIRKAQSQHPLHLQQKVKEKDTTSSKNQSCNHQTMIVEYQNQIQQYKAHIKSLTRALEGKENEIFEIIKESSIPQPNNLITLDLSNTIKSSDFKESAEFDYMIWNERIYDLQFKIRQGQMHRIKATETIERLQKDMALLTQKLNHEYTVKEKIVKHYKKKCAQLNKAMALADTLCTQQQHIYRHIPNLQQLRQRLKEAGSTQLSSRQDPKIEFHGGILNLVRAEDIEMPIEITTDMIKICNIIMSGIVDLFNKYVQRFNQKQLQRILEKYISAVDSMKFNEALNHLLEFIEDSLSQLPVKKHVIGKTEAPDISNSSVGEIKQKFIEAVGWEDLLPAIKGYVSDHNEASLFQIKTILNI